jgi:hypothetical protein
MRRSTADQSVATEAEETGLPWLRTWKGVYLVVIINFVLWVTLLVALTDFFS